MKSAGPDADVVSLLGGDQHRWNRLLVDAAMP